MRKSRRREHRLDSSNIPNDILIEIFIHLDMMTLHSLRLVCRRFNYLILNSSTLQRGMAYLDFEIIETIFGKRVFISSGCRSKIPSSRNRMFKKSYVDEALFLDIGSCSYSANDQESPENRTGPFRRFSAQQSYDAAEKQPLCSIEEFLRRTLRKIPLKLMNFTVSIISLYDVLPFRGVFMRRNYKQIWTHTDRALTVRLNGHLLSEEFLENCVEAMVTVLTEMKGNVRVSNALFAVSKPSKFRSLLGVFNDLGCFHFDVDDVFTTEPAWIFRSSMKDFCWQGKPISLQDEKDKLLSLIGKWSCGEVTIRCLGVFLNDHITEENLKSYAISYEAHENYFIIKRIADGTSLKVSRSEDGFVHILNMNLSCPSQRNFLKNDLGWARE